MMEEALIRIHSLSNQWDPALLKYTPAYPTKPFESLTAARQWVHTFVTWYNGTHRHSGIQYVTPDERHLVKDDAILARRKAIYEAARARQPAR